MRHLIPLTFATIIASGAMAGADAQGSQNRTAQPRQAPSASSDSGSRTDVALKVSFGTRDLEVIRAHYAPQYRNLPPGLAKKVARGGSLPPGWQKKWQPFPVALERRLPPLPAGYDRGVFEGHAVISRAGTIIDVAVLF
jgi:hypothetical protein